MLKPLLPLKKEFLLSLVNNNYSQRTIENYARDLLIIEMFLGRYGIEFQNLKRINIDEYKGYLKTGRHLEDLSNLKNQLMGVTNASDEKIEDQNMVSNDRKYTSIIDSALSTEVLIKSRPKGSKNDSANIGGLGSRSINRMLSSFRSYLAFLIDLDHEIPIPPGAIKMVKTEKRESQVAELSELTNLLESPESFELEMNVRYRNRAILELLFSTGMRISELTSLDISSLNYDRSKNKICDNKIFVFGKGKKQRYVYLTERCIFYLERYLQLRVGDEYEALFIPYRGIRSDDDDLDLVRLSVRYIQSMIKNYRKRLGIMIPTTPHSLRHGFATYLAEQGANPAAIQRLLGHESLQTTTRYVHASDRFAEKSHKDFHPLS